MTFLEKICVAFDDAGIDYAVVGGYAVALHGAVRGTVDVDFVLKWNKQTLLLAEQVLNEQGLVSRLPISAEDVFQFRREYIDKRNLVAWHFYNPDDLSEQVDIVITFNLKANATDMMHIGSTPVRVLKVRELIAMKKQSGRPQDLQDVAALEKLKK